MKIENTISFIKNLFHGDTIPLHEPFFNDYDIELISKCVESTFISSVSDYITQFEKAICEYTGAKFCIATVNGTSALHIALKLAGVKEGDCVVTTPLTFVATCNAIAYCGAKPVFVDIDGTLGMSPIELDNFLNDNKVSACVPVHVFGNPCNIKEIVAVCKKHNVPVIEDSAESLGSFTDGTHCGLFGKAGILSFNGNKIITTGGGGAIITNDEDFAKKARHLITQAKLPHKYEYNHDMVGYNYRMPGINAAVGLGQISRIKDYVSKKQLLYSMYSLFCEKEDIHFVPHSEESNCWLNSIVVPKTKRNEWLNKLNESGIMARPSWRLMNELEMYKSEQDLFTAKYYSERLINLPSSTTWRNL